MSRVTRTLLPASLLCAGLCALLCGCPKSAPKAEQPHPLSIAVTIVPAGLVASAVAEGSASVTVIIPPGSDPHTFEPAPSDIAAVKGADVLITIGPQLDGWARQLGAKREIRLMSLVPVNYIIDRIGGDDVTDFDREHMDPHLWTDPVIVADVAKALGQQLEAIDPRPGTQYEANAARFATELTQLDGWAMKQLARGKGQSVLQFHPSLEYLLARYGIESAGSVEASPGKEPSAKDLADLVAAAKAKHACAVLAEELLPDKPARVLAREAGIPVITLDPEAGGPRGYSTYQDWFMWNVNQLAAAFK